MAFKRMINAVDTHAGTPMRVITGGVPHIPGNSVYEKMKWLETNDDQLRKLMLREPRGYPAHCCNIIVPPTHPEADAGYIIMEQIEYPVMSGGNTISVVTVLLEMGLLPMQEPVTELVLEAPAGLIRGGPGEPALHHRRSAVCLGSQGVVDGCNGAVRSSSALTGRLHDPRRLPDSA